MRRAFVLLWFISFLVSPQAFAGVSERHPSVLVSLLCALAPSAPAGTHCTVADLDADALPSPCGASADCDGEETTPSNDNDALAPDTAPKRADPCPPVLSRAPPSSYLQTTLRLDTPPPRRAA